MNEQVSDNDRAGKQFLNGCLLALLFLSLLVVGSCLLVWKNKDTLLEDLGEGIEKTFKHAFNLPYYGEQSYIESKHGELIGRFKRAAQNNNSLLTFAATIEQMQLPEEVLYFSIVRGDDNTDVVKRLDWHGRSYITSGNYGAAKLRSAGKEIQVMVYKDAGPWAYMDEFIVYFEHSAGEAVPDSF